jgi:CO/xanthine dehydrogenase Mo-binding subunit
MTVLDRPAAPAAARAAARGRPDARAKATGAARYTEDFTPPGMLHGVVVRSPLAAARIDGVDTAAASRVDGVVRVLTAADLPDRRWGTYGRDQPLLARDVVRFAGEPVALVAAETRAAALAGAARVVLQLDERAPVVRLDDAIEPAAAEVHAGSPNVQPASRIERGDVEAALRAAAHVVHTRLESHRVHQTSIEPRVALAEPREDGGLVVTTTSQSPFEVREGLAHLLDLPMARIEVRVPTLGGGFGGKLHLGLAPFAAVMCLATGRPVRVVSTRAEELQAGNPRENSLVELTSAVDADGRVLARRARVHLDAGAYLFDTPAIAAIAALLGTGPYAVDAVDLAAMPVYTNTCPTGSFRGPSGPQMVYAVEAHMEEIAARIGIDGVELRRRNLVRAGDRGPSGQTFADPGIEDCLDRAAERLDAWRADPTPAPGRRVGHGLACAWWLTSRTPSGATVTLHEDGGATVNTGATEIGTGAVVSGVALLAAGELGLPVERVSVVSGSTAGGPYDGGSKGSRTLYGAGNATIAAAREAAWLLRRETARELGVAPESLGLADGRIGVVGDPDATLPLGEAVRRAVLRGGPVVGTARFAGPPTPREGAELTGMKMDAFNEPTFHCHAVEIALDEETGRVEVLRYLAVHDIGKVIDVEGARGQVEGGVVQGLGYALSELIDVDERGVVRNADLVDYRIPTIADVPRELEVVFVEDHPAPTGPHGAKGIGEASVIPPAAAVGAALRDALGRQPTRLPLDATRLCELLEETAAP